MNSIDREYENFKVEQQRYTEVLEEKRMISLTRVGYLITMVVPALLCVIAIPVSNLIIRSIDKSPTAGILWMIPTMLIGLTVAFIVAYGPTKAKEIAASLNRSTKKTKEIGELKSRAKNREAFMRLYEEMKQNDDSDVKSAYLEALKARIELEKE